MSSEGPRMTAHSFNAIGAAARTGGFSSHYNNGDHLSKHNMMLSNGFSEDHQFNPSYTIKEGGTLRRKIQPMAADKVSRQ
jgi:hypothetical protein